MERLIGKKTRRFICSLFSQNCYYVCVPKRFFSFLAFFTHKIRAFLSNKREKGALILHVRWTKSLLCLGHILKWWWWNRFIHFSLQASQQKSSFDTNPKRKRWCCFSYTTHSVLFPSLGIMPKKLHTLGKNSSGMKISISPFALECVILSWLSLALPK